MQENYRTVKDKVELKVGVGDINLEVDQVSQNEMNCTGIPTHTVLLSSQREVVLQQQALVSSNSQIPDMISTAVRENSLASGEVRDFIQELSDIGGGLIEQL